MLSNNKDNICISITHDDFKAVEVKKSGANAFISHVVVKNISEIKEESLPKIISSSLKGFKLKSSNISLIAPLSSITTKNIEIPSVNSEEIESIVSLQAGRHTPFARDEIQIGYINIGVHKNNYSKVLLVIANKNAIKDQFNTLAKAGIKVSKVLFAPEGISDFYARGLGMSDSPSPTAIIDVGDKTTELVLMSKGLTFTSRNIPIGKLTIKEEGEETQKKLIDEISKTVESSQTEEIISSPEKYVFTSNDEIIRGLQAEMQEKFNWNVEIVSYIDKIKASRGVVKQITTKFSAHSFLDIVASASISNSRNKTINLLPEEITMQEAIAAQGVEVFKMAILAFLLMLSICGLYTAKIFYQNNVLQKYNEKYEENKDRVLALERISESTKVVQRFLFERMSSLQIIDHIYADIPQQIYLTNMNISQDGSIKIEGISDVGSLIHNLVTKFNQSDFFANVNLIATNSRKDRGKDVHAFEITLKLKSLVDEDEDEMTKDAEE